MAADVKRCRGCSSELSHLLVDLGPSPLSNALVEHIDDTETFYPLRAYVCERCFLVQLPAVETPANIFNGEYAYFSSANAGFVEHARLFAESTIDKLGLTSDSLVIEVASNDGYLLQHFVARGIPVHGIEPSSNVAAVASAKGITTTVAFFGSEIARYISKADLIVANNVLAHVPDLHDFVEGLRLCLAPNGRVSIEFPHLLNLIEQTQFDTIYHEHYSYFSLLALASVFEAHGLSIIGVEELPTHGGSLRVWLGHRAEGQSLAAAAIIEREIDAGLNDLRTFDRFRQQVANCRSDFFEFLIRESDHGRTIAGYGAPAKGNTFLNYCGIKSDLLPWTVDSTPFKQGKYLPGTRIPIFAEEHIAKEQPETLLILAWNWSAEIANRARSLGYRGKFVTAIPTIRKVA